MLALVVALLLLASLAPHQVRVRAAICLNHTCTQRGAIAFEPVRIDLDAFIPRHQANRRLRLGLVCDGVPMLSEVDLDGQTDQPLVTRTYRDVVAGECVGVAELLRANGEHVLVTSAPKLTVLSRG